MLAAADGGADDVVQDGSSSQITTSPEALSAVREALDQAGIEVDSAEITLVPKTTVEISDEAGVRKTLRLIDELDELDDVNDVYSNFDIPERLLETVET
jgi:transcriptional/translational regulatory protein YebC/TACO1